MKKLLSLFATVLIAVGVNAQKVVSEIDWTQEKSFPAGWIYSEGATVSVTSEGLTIESNPAQNANYWEPQIPVIKGFKLEKGRLYQVKITLNSPVAGELHLDLGSWDGSGASKATVINVTKGIKEYSALFLDYPVSCTDAHVLYQCGKLPGKHAIKEVKVIDLNKTPLEGDLNHDGEVNAADVVCLVDVIMKQKPKSPENQLYWYYGYADDFNNGSYPGDGTIYSYDDADYQTYNAKPGWYYLDTTKDKFQIPFAESNDWECKILCIAIPESSGFDEVLNFEDTPLLSMGEATKSTKTINGVNYIVFTLLEPNIRIMGFLFKTSSVHIEPDDPTDPSDNHSYWYYGTADDFNKGSYPTSGNAKTYTNDDYMTYDATESSWYFLDTSVDKLEIPYAVGDITNEVLCIAVPISSGFNDILNNLEDESLVGRGLKPSIKRIKGINYNVYTCVNHGRLMGYLIKK